MNMLNKIKSKFTPIKTPVAKARSTVGSHCLTKDFDQASWVILGVADDRGIKNNFGRDGAKKGPAGFRDFFYAQGIGEISPPESKMYDVGDLKLHKNLGTTLHDLKRVVQEIKTYDPKKKIFVIGGGHDIAFGEIAGCIATSRNPSEHHVVNTDAHSDVRPLEKGNIVTSGTPFFRLIDEEGLNPSNYHPFGLQRPSNNPQLVAWMNSKGVNPSWLESMPTVTEQIISFRNLLKSFEGKPWHLSIDMDGFPMSVSPGVSAPGVFGIAPEIFLTLDSVKRTFATLESFGIYELAPNLDEHEKSQRLAAKLAYLIFSVSTL